MTTRSTTTTTTTKGFTDMLKELPRKKDCCRVILTQRNTLRKYEETNEMMRQFLELSEATHKILLEKFTTHSKTLTQLKKDLENCFKRIRFLKTKLQARYPEAFEATADAIKELQEKYNLEETERPPTYHDGDNTIQKIQSDGDSTSPTIQHDGDNTTQTIQHDGDNTTPATDITHHTQYDGDRMLADGGESSVELPTNNYPNNIDSENMSENMLGVMTENSETTVENVHITEHSGTSSADESVGQHGGDVIGSDGEGSGEGSLENTKPSDTELLHVDGATNVDDDTS